MKLPVVSSDDVIKALKKAGFEVVRQRGSHVSLHKKTPEGILLTWFQENRDKERHTFEYTQAGEDEQGRFLEVALGLQGSNPCPGAMVL